MATQPYYDGPCLIRVGTGSAGALEDLGYTEDGADVDIEGFFENVWGDQGGGPSGVPIDVQYFGELARIRLTLTKWDAAIADKVVPRVNGATAGTPATPGTLMFQESKSIRLLLSPTSRPLNFPRAFLRGNYQINKGVKHSKIIFEFECHKDGSGVLFNATTS